MWRYWRSRVEGEMNARDAESPRRRCAATEVGAFGRLPGG